MLNKINDALPLYELTMKAFRSRHPLQPESHEDLAQRPEITKVSYLVESYSAWITKDSF